MVYFVLTYYWYWANDDSVSRSTALEHSLTPVRTNWLGVRARFWVLSPGPGPTVSLLAVVATLLFGAPRPCDAATAIVPDDYPTVQLGIDSGADTILVRAGTYAENVLLVTNGSPVVLMADSAASPRPTLQGLTLKANHSYEGDRKVVGLRIVNPVDIQSGSVSARYDFEACRLEAGVRHVLGQPEYSHAGRATTFLRCMLRGNTNLIVASLTMESDTVEAGGASFATGGSVRVSNCWFRNSPIGLETYQVKSGFDVQVVESVFEDCGTGLRAYDSNNSGEVRIENNNVRNCRDCGIRLENVEYAHVLGNDVRQCGGGIEADVRGAGPFRVMGNTVIGASSTGMTLRSDNSQVEVRNNVVLRCGGTGIAFVATSPYTTCSLVGNTSAHNGGSGYDLAYGPAYGSVIIDMSNNVAYGNADRGFRWTGVGSGPPTLACNDWFANTSGAVYGAVPGATDLAVDPLFCDFANNDVRLRSDSPLLGGACGTIGAHGIGCDASTEVLVALLAAEASDEGVRIRWRLGGDERPVSVWMERSAGELGPWQSVATERTYDGPVTVDWDRTAEPGRRYWYRLAWTTPDGRQSYSSPIVIDLASLASSLALSVIGPNPASGPVAIEYALPRSTAIDLTVHDLMGREVTRLASGQQSKGLHVTQWTGNVRGGRAAPGLYFVRLSSPDGQQSRRILLRK